jgi:DNA-binding NarL/FixJ family response regulator
MQRRATDPPREPFELDPSAQRLAPHEHAIALLVADGLNDDEIAARRGVTVGTVRTVIMRGRWKLQLARRSDLAAWVRARLDPSASGGRLRRIDDAHPK